MNGISPHCQKSNPIQVLLCYIRERKIDCFPVGSDSPVSLSFIDSVKISLLKKAANVGLNTESVEVLSKNLQQKITNSEIDINVLDGAVLDILLEKGRSCISFNLKGHISSYINGQTLISIDLHEIINNTFPGLPVKVEEFCMEPVKSDEQKALSILRNKNFHAVRLIKKGTALDRAECEEKLPINKRVIDAMKDAPFQDIEIKQESGKAVFINRTIKTKI